MDSSDKNDAQIYSLIIGEAGGFPPPSPYWEPNGVEWNNYIDSIHRVPIKIGVFLKKKKYNNPNIRFKDEYKILEKKLIKTDANTIIDLNKIEVRNSITLIPLVKDDFSLNSMVRFSEIIYNEELDKAIVVAMIDFSKPFGFYTMYKLERIEGKWEIIEREGLVVS